MKFYILVAVLVFTIAVVISYVYDHLAVRRATRRDRKKLLAQLTSQPTVRADFSTPEGCLDLAGNIWEWTSSMEENKAHAFAMGGCWAHMGLYTRTTAHFSNYKGARVNLIGFRLFSVPPKG